jgi:hypothetical protein
MDIQSLPNEVLVDILERVTASDADGTKTQHHLLPLIYASRSFQSLINSILYHTIHQTSLSSLRSSSVPSSPAHPSALSSAISNLPFVQFQEEKTKNYTINGSFTILESLGLLISTLLNRSSSSGLVSGNITVLASSYPGSILVWASTSCHIAPSESVGF